MSSNICTWTYEQDVVLIEGWGILPDSDVAEQAGHTRLSCERRASLLGIYKRHRYRTPGMLARVLRLHPNTVTYWITKGWLHAERSPVKASKGYMWHIPDQALADFLLHNPRYAAIARREHELAAQARAERIEVMGSLEEEDYAA